MIYVIPNTADTSPFTAATATGTAPGAGSYATLIPSDGARTFIPATLPKLIRYVGGVAVPLTLVDRADVSTKLLQALAIVRRLLFCFSFVFLEA